MKKADLERIFAEVRQQITPKDPEDLVRQMSNGMSQDKEVTPSELTILALDYSMRYAEDFLQRVLEKALVDEPPEQSP